MRTRATLLLAALLVAAADCKTCRSCRDDDEEEEQEERNLQRDHFWRAQIAIVGRGRVKTVVDAFDCTSDGAAQGGLCGPTLVRFKESSPP